MNVISRGIRNAFRNGIRTFSITIILALSIGLALTMLTARQAVTAKIEAVKSSIGNTITISPAGSRGFEGGGEPLTTDTATKVAATAHVTSVIQTLGDRLDSDTSNLISAIQAGTLGRRFNGGNANQGQTGGTQRTGNFTPPVVVTGVNNLDGNVLNGGGAVSLTSGSKFDPNVDATVALVGKDLASKNNLSVGSTFTAYNTTVTVSGIFDAGNTFANNTVVMPLATVQRLSGQNAQLSSIIAQVDSISNITDTTVALKSTLGSTADVVNVQDSSNQALAPLQNIQTITAYSLIGAIIAGAVIILLTMLMIVRERRREIGVLKAIGASNLKVMWQFMTEAITFTLMGAIVGFGLGIVGSNPVAQALVSSSNGSPTSRGQGPGSGFGRGGNAVTRFISQGGDSLRTLHTSVGWSLLFYGLAAALIIAVLGSVIPVWLISKVQPSEVMRAE